VWYSYAQWPSEEARTNAFAEGAVEPDAQEKMKQAIDERLPEIVMEPVSDYVLPLTNNVT
jgi:hypothetical protein